MNKCRKRNVVLCMLVAFILAGCGQAKVPDVVDVTSIVVTEEGAVTSYLVDEFDKEYYNISDLTAMAIEEVADYNTENQVGETIPITVDKVEALQDGSNKIVVTHKYSNTDTFMDYNGSVLFYGTVAEAVAAGYDLDVALKNVKDNTLLSEEQLKQYWENYLLITNEKAMIYCPKKVTHVSDSAVYTEDGSIDALQAEDMVVILMK